MSIDLEKSLAELAEAVGDDGAAERMTGQVRHMVGRIRRRRAVRRTANGVVGVAAAGAVVLGGSQLAGRTPVAPADSAAPDADTGFGTCGSTVVEPNPMADLVLALEGSMRPPGSESEGEDPHVDVNVTFVGDVRGLTELSEPTLVVARDGVVVTRGSGVTTREGSFPPAYGFRHPMVSCADGEPLPAGEYEAFMLQPFGDTSDGLSAILGGPWPITYLGAGAPGDDEGLPVEPTEAPAAAGGAGDDDELVQAREVLAALLASDPTGAFPSCGSSTDTMDDGMPPLALTGLLLGERVYASGEDILGEVTLTTTEGRSVIGNASGAGAHLVLTQEGRVVGTVYRDAEDATVVDLAPGDELAVPLTGRLQLCGVPMTDGPQLLLPPGTYQAYAVLDVMVKELTEADGTASGETFGTLAFSPPVDVTVG